MGLSGLETRAVFTTGFGAPVTPSRASVSSVLPLSDDGRISREGEVDILEK